MVLRDFEWHRAVAVLHLWIRPLVEQKLCRLQIAGKDRKM